MPNVVGLTQAEAVTAITGAGLTVGGVTVVNSTEPAGTVIGQTPAGGTTVDPGSGVDVVVSLGPGNQNPVFIQPRTTVSPSKWACCLKSPSRRPTPTAIR